MDINWFTLIPIPVALGVVLYVNYRFDNHEQNCSVQKQLELLNNKIDLILDHLLNKK